MRKTEAFTTLLWALVVSVMTLLLASTQVLAEERTPLDKALDRIWGKERETTVIAKRAVEKDGRHEFTFHLGIAPNNPFFYHIPLGLRYSYWVIEPVAVELTGAYVFSSQTTLQTDLESSKFLSGVRDLQRGEWYSGVNAYWAPIYGKFALLSKKVATFDVGFVVGLVVVGTKVMEKGVWQRKSAPDVGGVVGLGTHFFINDWMAVRADYRHYVYKGYFGGARSLAEISFGFALFTKAPK